MNINKKDNTTKSNINKISAIFHIHITKKRKDQRRQNEQQKQNKQNRQKKRKKQNEKD